MDLSAAVSFASRVNRLMALACRYESRPSSSSHQQAPAVFGGDGYIWEFLAATFENWQSEFLQLLAMVVLTSFLIQSRQRRVQGQQRSHGSQAR